MAVAANPQILIAAAVAAAVLAGAEVVSNNTNSAENWTKGRQLNEDSTTDLAVAAARLIASSEMAKAMVEDEAVGVEKTRMEAAPGGPIARSRTGVW